MILPLFEMLRNQRLVCRMLLRQFKMDNFVLFCQFQTCPLFGILRHSSTVFGILRQSSRYPSTNYIIALKLTEFLFHFYFRTTENMLHRLFVCIAGVADQLQTNFASDLRQILRSVFLINTTPPQPPEEIIQTKPKESDFFEFRASENDVIQENGGSNQSIYSAEEVNPDTISVFELRQERSASLETDVRVVRNIERSRSLAEDSENSAEDDQRPIGENRRCNSVRARGRSFDKDTVNSRSDSNSSDSSAADNSPVARSRASHEISNVNNQSPPRWIPDDEAPRCMSCAQSFTTFRRRHHCRNCGRVFCGVCSNTSAPLPKYGWTKAVRVCRDCFDHKMEST